MSYHGMPNVRQNYFRWLCDLVRVDRIDGRSYWDLMKDLYSIRFVPLVDHDDNREYDGLELRDECLRDLGYPKYTDIPGPCSVLEMIIGLARRMEFETSGFYEDEGIINRTEDWFWEMIGNLGLLAYDDESYVELGGRENVEDIIKTLVERRYDGDGDGGLFPLKRPSEDQRDIEIWYQMSAYLYENGWV